MEKQVMGIPQSGHVLAGRVANGVGVQRDSGFRRTKLFAVPSNSVSVTHANEFSFPHRP